MTLAEIITSVTDNTKRTDKDSVIRTGVNLAFKRCAQQHPFRAWVRTDEIDVQAGVSSVQLQEAVRVYAAYWINGTQSWRLLGRSREWVVRQVPNNDATPVPSYPYWAYLSGSVLNFTPSTSIAGTMRVTYQYVPVLTNDVDSNTVSLLDETIISFATSWVLKSVQLWNEASFWEQNYNNSLAIAIDADRSQPFDEKQMDQFGCDYGPYIDPVDDPFAGHTGMSR